MPPILGYWPARGLAGQIRLLLHYVGEEFENKIYLFNEGDTNARRCTAISIRPDHAYNVYIAQFMAANIKACRPQDPANFRTEFYKEKYKLGLPLPNLPYYIDGDVKLTQSVAIERYLARKYKLEATTETDRIRQDNLLYLAVDIQMRGVILCFRPDFEKVKADHVKWLKEVYEQLSTLLGDSQYFMGPGINFVDFHLCESFSMNSGIEPTSLDAFPKLKAFVERIENLPRIKEYLNSPGYVKEALVAPGASFGYVPYNPKKEWNNTGTQQPKYVAENGIVFVLKQK